MSRATIPARPAAEPESEHDSENNYGSDQPRGAPSLERQSRSTRDRRNRGREDNRDRRPVPATIKIKSLPLQLQLADPISQYGRWYFSVKGHLMAHDPLYCLLVQLYTSVQLHDTIVH